LQQKAVRISHLAKYIVKDEDKTNAKRAGELCKSDLVSDMVKEFPELQGIMGYYYALNDKESNDVAIAIRDHYCPKFAGDCLPENAIGDAVAIADRIDTLVCVFGINKIPTGDKDPFALRRAGLGILRILIEKQYSLNIFDLIEQAIKNCENDSFQFANKETKVQVYYFILERLRSWYLDKEIAADTLNAVLDDKENCATPYDVHLRIMAVNNFRNLPEAKSLSAANKRAHNILLKSVSDQQVLEHLDWKSIDVSLFAHDAEKNLYNALGEFINDHSEIDYNIFLNNLASLRQPIDTFFDNVMVMSEDENVRNNRLSLLMTLRKLFLKVADISKLQE
jgi:glycyl-tRNA synthetase beta chain